jgi:hypothetical protein
MYCISNVSCLRLSCCIRMFHFLCSLLICLIGRVYVFYVGRVVYMKPFSTVILQVNIIIIISRVLFHRGRMSAWFWWILLDHWPGGWCDQSLRPSDRYCWDRECPCSESTGVILLLCVFDIQCLCVFVIHCLGSSFM